MPKRPHPIPDELERFAPERTGKWVTVSYQLPGNESPTPIPCMVIDGWLVAEGDIVLGREEDMEQEDVYLQHQGNPAGMQPQVVVRGESYLWPGGVMPYEVDDAFADVMVDRIERAIDMVNSRSVLRLMPRNADRHSDYIVFTQVEEARWCSAQVGRQGGLQRIWLSRSQIGVRGCSVGVIAHEILHAAGLWHEHSRSDRDEYVEILWDNIPAEFHPQFEKKDAIDVRSYDYDSIMHYPRQNFGSDTIIPRIPGVSIGQRSDLSTGDVMGIYRVYRVLVPAVAGLPEDKAMDALRSAGLRGGVNGFVHSELPRRTVVSQNPRADSYSDRGARVALTLSNGRGELPPDGSRVPNLVGQDHVEALSMLHQMGFDGRLDGFASSDRPFGEVIGQQPIAGTQVDPGAKVHLVASRGPGEIQ